jgi:hypothetical protein
MSMKVYEKEQSMSETRHDVCIVNYWNNKKKFSYKHDLIFPAVITFVVLTDKS